VRIVLCFAGIGAVAGAVFGGLGFALGHSPWVIQAYGLAGGVLSDMAGGKFGEGFVMGYAPHVSSVVFGFSDDI